MNSEIVNINEIAKDVFAVLTEQKLLMESSCEKFDTLVELIKQSNTDDVEQLLDELTVAQQTQIQIDAKLIAIRASIALQMNTTPGQVSIGKLIDHLEGELKNQLAEIRKQLITLAEKLKKKHLASAYLIFEASRVNKMLFEGLFAPIVDVETYNAEGKAGRHAGAGLVNTER